MNELGQWLREAREAKGLSLAEAEATTRIRQKFLAALEADEWDILPGDVATVGFLRKYAIYLGLDPQVVVERFRSRGAARPTVPEALEPLPERPVDYRPIELELEAKPARRIPWRTFAALLTLLIVVVAIGAVLLLRPSWVRNLSALLPDIPLLGGPAPTDTPAILTTPTRIVIRVTATPTATSLATATPTATETPTAQTEAATTPAVSQDTPTPAAPIVESILLQLVTAQRAWVSVTVDGQTVLETILEAGETREWEGRQFVSVRTGNAAGILLTVNGEPQEPLGGPGEVVELRWSLADGEIIRSTPEPTPRPTATLADVTPTP